MKGGENPKTIATKEVTERVDGSKGEWGKDLGKETRESGEEHKGRKEKAIGQRVSRKIVGLTRMK